MQTSIEWMSALELREAIVTRQISPTEVMRATLDRLERLEGDLNCFASYTPELAIQAAMAAEQSLMRGDPPGALHGLPISVKDLIAVKDVRLGFGSRVMAANIASADAPAVERIRNAGACIVGKTTTSEFGCKAVGDSPLTGITRNPWDHSKTPGGSSAGAAASVAAGLTPFALGTDGGGSLRIPAALTGIFGIKAQFGRVPVYPVSATPTLAHVGPLARTVRDAAMLLEAISGYDARDPFSATAPVPGFLAACDRPVAGLRIAWSPTLGYAKPDPEVLEIAERSVKVFEDLGCTVEEVEHPLGADPIDLWVSEFYAGVGVRLKKPMTDERHLLDQGVVDILDGALAQSSEEYYSNVFRRYELREKLRLFFERYDLLITPTLPCAAFDMGLNTPPQLTDRNIVSWVYYTYPFNLTGQPAASIPAGFTRAGLPVGIQIVSRAHCENDIFSAAAGFESAQPWSTHRPSEIPRIERLT